MSIIYRAFGLVYFISFLQLFAQNIYFGDMHTHSGLSYDAVGNIDSLYKIAREGYKLDFVCFSDHDYGSTDAIWTIAKTKANYYNFPNVFVTLIGYEWTKGAYSDGHRVVLYPSSDPPRFSVSNTTLDSLYTKVLKAGGIINICHPDHELYHTNKDKRDSSVQRNIEIFGYDRKRFEYYGNPNAPNNQRINSSVQDWLRLNEPIGIIGVSDSHTGKPGSGGLTAVIANELTRESIFNAIKARHVYATTGARIKVNFNSGAFIMGDKRQISFNEKVNFNLVLEAPKKITLIEILKNNRVVITLNPNATTFRYSYETIIQEQYENFYLRMTQEDGEMAWSSPIFFELKNPITFIDKINYNNNGLNLLPNYPNPFNSSTIIKFYTNSKEAIDLKLYDIIGRIVFEKKISTIRNGLNEFDLDLRMIASGVYVVKLSQNSNNNYLKILKVN